MRKQRRLGSSKKSSKIESLSGSQRSWQALFLFMTKRNYFANHGWRVIAMGRNLKRGGEMVAKVFDKYYILLRVIVFIDDLAAPAYIQIA